MARETMTTLRDRIRDLQPYEEFFYCRADKPVAFVLANRDGDERTVELYGIKRASGGVIVDGPMVSWASDYCARLLESGDAYRVDLAHRIHRETGASF